MNTSCNVFQGVPSALSGFMVSYKKALSSTVWELLAIPQKAIEIFAVLTKMGRGLS
jgi:hypothetical protein